MEWEFAAVPAKWADAQSLAGKLVGELAARCRASARPLHLVAGTVTLDEQSAYNLGAESVQEASTLAELEAAGAELALEDPRE